MFFNDRIREFPNMKFLIYAETESDAWIIASVLNEYGIPTHMDAARYGGSLSVILGSNSSGINIYVPEEIQYLASESERSGTDPDREERQDHGDGTFLVVGSGIIWKTENIQNARKA